MVVDISETLVCKMIPDLIQQTEAFVRNHYTNCIHPTGETYYEYACQVVDILRDLHVDPTTIAAALLHYLPAITNITIKDLQRQFGEEVGELVEEISKLGKLEWNILPIHTQQPKLGQFVPIAQERNELQERTAVLRRMFLLAIGETKSEGLKETSSTARYFQKKEKQVENLIKMLIAATNDIRAIIIKLADRLHFMQCLLKLLQSQHNSINIENSIIFVKIMLAVYAPLADRLGIWELKWRIEDLSFQFLHPDKYNELVNLLALEEFERENYVENSLIPTIKEVLDGFGIKAEISGRAKHIYSIHRKMEEKKLTFEQINDLFGVRIIVKSNEDCYNAQSILHEMWKPITEVYNGKTGRDWIANPKENLYQSLHTTIQINEKEVEVQIRTHDMHRIAEYGAAAAHWQYKDTKRYKKVKVARANKNRELIRSQQLAALRTNTVDILDPTQRSLVKDWIFVITPMGHVIGLHAPTGATPIDLAYRIHTNMGHMYGGAKIIGGHSVGADYTLKNGDCVELFKSRTRKGPNAAWLNRMRDEDGKLRYTFVRTRQARTKIRHWLNQERSLATSQGSKAAGSLKK